MGLVNRQWGVYSVPAYEKPGGGTSYHYQTPPLLAKKPLWSMVVRRCGEARRVERRSAIGGGGRTASGLSVKSQDHQPNGPAKRRPVARVSANPAA